jgi:D-arginine dehydrogenase
VKWDVAIVGAGMAGASLAARVAPHASVLLLEAESQPGYHSTGRSAAFWTETYGGPDVQPLTTASGPFLAEHGFLRPRGCIHLADEGGRAALATLAAAFAGSDVELQRLDRAALDQAIVGLKPGWDQGISEPTCADIDVAGLHGLYLKQARCRRRAARHECTPAGGGARRLGLASQHQCRGFRSRPAGQRGRRMGR